MEFDNTRKRFKKRVELERKILTLVNSSTNIQQLHGLSGPAITAWKDSFKSDDISEFAGILESLANDLQIFCDTSKNSFDLDKRFKSSDIDKSIKRLKSYLQENWNTQHSDAAG